MPRRTWHAHTTAMIVLEGLQGKLVAEICTEHQISQSQYDPWRDPCLTHMGNAFEVQQHTRTEARLAHEHARLKKLVGELLPELKKGDKVLG